MLVFRTWLLSLLLLLLLLLLFWLKLLFVSFFELFLSRLLLVNRLLEEPLGDSNTVLVTGFNINIDNNAIIAHKTAGINTTFLTFPTSSPTNK